MWLSGETTLYFSHVVSHSLAEVPHFAVYQGVLTGVALLLL
jgi:hypothetical protein